MEGLVTAEKAAEVLDISRPTLLNLVKEGALVPFARVNDRWPIFDKAYLRTMQDHPVVSRRRRKKYGKVA